MRYLPIRLASLLKDLGFRVLKTKATYYPPWLEDGRDHILVQATATGVEVYTVHGCYGCRIFTMKESEATPGRFIAVSLKIKRNSDTKDYVDLYVDIMRKRLARESKHLMGFQRG